MTVFKKREETIADSNKRKGCQPENARELRQERWSRLRTENRVGRGGRTERTQTRGGGSVIKRGGRGGQGES